jgi:hypothetical protein
MYKADPPYQRMGRGWEEQDPGREGIPVKTYRRAAVAVFLLFVISVLAAPVLAAEAETDDEKTPSTAVARLKIVKGTVWVRPADSGEWEEYSHNSPVAERARVSVPQGSEAELQFRGSQFLLLEQGAEVDVRQFGEQRASFRLRSGKVAFSLPKEDFAPVAVKVPGNRDVRLDSPGLYWLTVDGGETKFRVRRGEGSVVAEGAQPVAVKTGEEASIGKEVRVSTTGQAAPEPAPETTLTEAEQKAGIPQAAATELRDYGEWVQTQEYGSVWRPYVADGWSPYYYGRWTWVYPYGWNWVGYEPWGWWPYHYGGWVSYPAYGWVWCPFNAFFSAGFYYGGYPYSYRYGYYYPGNVRWVNDGRNIRWVPAQPGRTTNRTTFARSDTRLARWDKPMAAGTVTTRSGGGRPAATGGQSVAGVRATTGRAAGAPQTDQRVTETSGARGNSGSAGRAAVGRTTGQAGSRPSPEGGGQVSAIRQGTGVPWRSPGTQTTSSRYSSSGSGGQGRAPAGSGAVWSGGGDRGVSPGYGVRGGYSPSPPAYNTVPRSSEGAARSYEGGGSRSYDGGGGGRSWGGSWGGGGGSRGGGGYGGGGGGRSR